MVSAISVNPVTLSEAPLVLVDLVPIASLAPAVTDVGGVGRLLGARHRVVPAGTNAGLNTCMRAVQCSTSHVVVSCCAPPANTALRTLRGVTVSPVGAVRVARAVSPVEHETLRPRLQRVRQDQRSL